MYSISGSSSCVSWVCQVNDGRKRKRGFGVRTNRVRASARIEVWVTKSAGASGTATETGEAAMTAASIQP